MAVDRWLAHIDAHEGRFGDRAEGMGFGRTNRGRLPGARLHNRRRDINSSYAQGPTGLARAANVGVVAPSGTSPTKSTQSPDAHRCRADTRGPTPAETALFSPFDASLLYDGGVRRASGQAEVWRASRAPQRWLRAGVWPPFGLTWTTKDH